MSVETDYLDISKVCKLLRDKGLVNATHGNVSFRHGNIMYITRSGSDLESIKKEDISLVDLTTKKVLEGGAPIPSKEYLMHAYIYDARSDVNAVVHAHSPNSVAVGCLGEVKDPTNIVPSYTLSFALFTKYLPMIPYYKAGSEELAREACKGLGEGSAVLLQFHGLITVSDTLMKAFYRLEEIEENCSIALKIGLKNNNSLDPKEL